VSYMKARALNIVMGLSSLLRKPMFQEEKVFFFCHIIILLLTQLVQSRLMNGAIVPFFFACP